MPTEQEAKPAVVTPSLQQWRSPSTFRGAPGEDPLNGLKKEVHRLVNQTQESLDSDPQSLEEIVQDEVKVLAPVSTKPTETRPRPTYAAVTRKYRAPVQKFPPEPRKSDVWRTVDNRPVCFTAEVLDIHDILGWDFLEASQAVIDCGQNELVLEDICRDSTAPDAWNLYATRDYTLKPHSLTRITVSGYQTRGDK
ncbi:CCHC-type domain-containing protein [Trichonephila clavipes]|nr:CCHC-type domain-containing protein [Trichonephila clavipes]